MKFTSLRELSPNQQLLCRKVKIYHRGEKNNGKVQLSLPYNLNFNCAQMKYYGYEFKYITSSNELIYERSVMFILNLEKVIVKEMILSYYNN